jgi:hypothetical protein
MDRGHISTISTISTRNGSAPRTCCAAAPLVDFQLSWGGGTTIPDQLGREVVARYRPPLSRSTQMRSIRPRRDELHLPCPLL